MSSIRPRLLVQSRVEPEAVALPPGFGSEPPGLGVTGIVALSVAFLAALWFLVSRTSRSRPSSAGSGRHAERQGEKELLRAMERHGEITPAKAALETSLSVAEADRKLSELAARGYLEVHVRDGKLLYAL